MGSWREGRPGIGIDLTSHRTFFLSLNEGICYPEAIVRRLFLTICLCVCGLIALGARAEAYKLTTGETLNGEVLPTSANDQGVQVKIGEGQYQRVPWASFSQEDLRNFSKNERMQPFVEPFIEITADPGKEFTWQYTYTFYVLH